MPMESSSRYSQEKETHQRETQQGAIMVEMVIVIIPFLTVVFGVAQLALMYMAGLAVNRSATTAARAAIVVYDDDPDNFGGQSRNSSGGQRAQAVEIAASFPIYAFKNSPKSADSIRHSLRASQNGPYSTTNSVAPGLTVSYPDGIPSGRGDSIKVKVEYEMPCEVPVVKAILCDNGTRKITAETNLPNMVADYEYGQW